MVQSPRKYRVHSCLCGDAPASPPRGDVSSMNRENPLYESQEIRMEMFADVSDEEEGSVPTTHWVCMCHCVMSAQVMKLMRRSY